jgi:hypothetical protein
LHHNYSELIKKLGGKMDRDAEKALMELDHKLQNFGDKLSKISRDNPGEGISLLNPKSFSPHQALIDAYTIIRNWYVSNIRLARNRGDDFGDKSFALTEQLPEAGELSELEIRAVLVEVIMGNLEWAFRDDYQLSRWFLPDYTGATTLNRCSASTHSWTVNPSFFA